MRAPVLDPTGEEKQGNSSTTPCFLLHSRSRANGGTCIAPSVKPVKRSTFVPCQAGQGRCPALLRKGDRWKRRAGDGDDRQERGESAGLGCGQILDYLEVVHVLIRRSHSSGPTLLEAGQAARGPPSGNWATRQRILSKRGIANTNNAMIYRLAMSVRGPGILLNRRRRPSITI